MLPLKANAIAEYYQEIDLLGKEGLLKILDKGKQWDLSKTLQQGGSAIFPHTFMKECGYQIASVVHGCLNSGAKTVVALGVLHALTDELLAAKKQEELGEDVSHNPKRGIFFPNKDGDILRKEFSLHFFKLLWDLERTRRSHAIPELVFKYPFLVNRTPQLLPGIDHLQDITKNAVVVATADLCHYGKAYDCQKEKPINADSLAFAKKMILTGFEVLKSGNYREYYNYCKNSLSDSANSCSVLRYLLGPLQAQIKDIKLVNVASLFDGSPSPSWVAATLVEMKKAPQI
ncbi:MAG: hypothetical protein KAR79_04675 [Simkaniaceae bacterium]|nr:hypothetical protein [Simkaniaceae bacterium]